jgi:hypothetical protein
MILAPIAFLIVMLVLYLLLFPLIMKSSGYGEIFRKHYVPFMCRLMDKINVNSKSKEEQGKLKSDMKIELGEIRQNFKKDLEENIGATALKNELKKDIKDIFK